MSIQLISISHKTAPLAIRTLFSFSAEAQAQLRHEMLQTPDIEECVLLSTCNRTEVYVYAHSDVSSRKIVQNIQHVLLKSAGALDEPNIYDYLLFYQDQKAIHHLFQVTTGLDSMVIGEDQILGQVKDAHEAAMADKSCSVYLNTLFRYAITAAKKVKTETALSKTSVSTATLAVKMADTSLADGLKDKNVMIIGASGKIGGIVLKNLISLHQAHLYVTTRSTNFSKGNRHGREAYTVMPYQARYHELDAMDVIISATSSPHYTLTAEKTMSHLKTQKPRVFIDLAVPMDIEGAISELPEVISYNIDDFSRMAEENNQKKYASLSEADAILEHYELEFNQWFIFRKSMPVISDTRAQFLKIAEEKGASKAFDQLIYHVREGNSPEDLQAFFRCIGKC